MKQSGANIDGAVSLVMIVWERWYGDGRVCSLPDKQEHSQAQSSGDAGKNLEHCADCGVVIRCGD